MATEIRTDPRRDFVPRRLPWLLAAAMLLVYWLTLNRWVSLFNVASVAKISGWTWQPEMLNPITFLVTFPLRWLPATVIPLALNFFSAVCAVLTLALLARSVALLPHDRTDAQREREKSDFSFLTTGSAWLPPLLAVLVCGLQLTFWERATNWTGEMFDLLLFAFVIWSLLEYRLDEQEWRLYVAGFVYARGDGGRLGDDGFLPAVPGGDRVAAWPRIFQLALSGADIAVRAGGTFVLSAAASAGGGCPQNAGHFLAVFEVQPVAAVWRFEDLLRLFLRIRSNIWNTRPCCWPT